MLESGDPGTHLWYKTK